VDPKLKNAKHGDTVGGFMYTVALVEDDPNTSELLAIYLGKCKGLKLVGVYDSGQEALRDLPTRRPDVVLMDIKLPGMSGIDCVRALRTRTPAFKSPILMLTECAEGQLIFDALKAGANGYLLKKHASPRELHAAIQEVFTGGAPFSPSIARKVVEYFHTADVAAAPATKLRTKSLPQLSEREEAVLELLNRGLAYKEIADSLGITIDGVSKHLQSIYRKLHVRSRSEAMIRSGNRGFQGSPP
jgi:DNA-binding NarL/FixJ family response regulator